MLMKNIWLIIIQSACCEKFQISVEEVESGCFELLKNKNCPDSHKYLCKNILRLNESFSKMSACGLFDIDAALPIALAGVISKYIVAILQFLFL
ncbi:hypothetical protein HF086_006405 [Spodoptera exigua]|uniref:Uncharacterized protein n=1 Tax=Spodoptera exigua TaxID=7107 RepID=A0A922MXV6_SPOEX|nr:hypothetical protein HF086_006405 [Spodoptera exigua]